MKLFCKEAGGSVVTSTKRNQREELMRQTHWAVWCNSLIYESPDPALFLALHLLFPLSSPGNQFRYHCLTILSSLLRSHCVVPCYILRPELACPCTVQGSQLCLSIPLLCSWLSANCHSSDGDLCAFQYRYQHPGQRQTHSGLSTDRF